MYGYVIFTDIEKYSTLKDADLKIYFNKIIPIISEELKIYKDSAIIWNTWGDAIFAIYDKAETAINMALAYRESFNKLNFEEFGIRKLTPRIAGNFGEFELVFDPVSGKQNVHGTLVNLTARIEPVTTPGEIFVTKEFMDMSRSSYDKIDNVRFEDMGEIKLPKNAGALTLYRLCKKEEAPSRPIGIIHSSMNYNIQAPVNLKNKSDDSKIKPVEKSIEQRLSTNLNRKVSSEEKLIKIASVLKDEKTLRKKETNFIQTLIQDFKINKNLKTKRNFKGILADSPFSIAILVFVIAMITNFILETDFAKNLFNWIGYYLNSTLLTLNMPMLNSLMKSEFMTKINPWMWLRGFIIGSFLVGQVVTLIQKKVIKFKNIIITPSLIVILHLGFYILPNSSTPSALFFMQNFYLNIFLLWLACTTGFLQGTEYAGDKIKTLTHH